MALTRSDPNQVAVNGRRVLVGWIEYPIATWVVTRHSRLSCCSSSSLLKMRVPGLRCCIVQTPRGARVVTATTAQQLSHRSFLLFVRNFPVAPVEYPVRQLGFAGSIRMCRPDCGLLAAAEDRRVHRRRQRHCARARPSPVRSFYQPRAGPSRCTPSSTTVSSR